MREKELMEKQQHDPKHVKMAVGIASDPRHKGGDYTGAHKKIEKIAKGLASHPQVAAVLKKQNEAVKEGLGDLAHAAERDHEVQMARADLYKLAKYAIKLHDMLKGVSEAEGLEGWVQSKITKSADMIGSVYHHMDYENSPMGEVTEAKDTHCSDKCCGADTKAEDCTCPPSCEHCNCNSVNEGEVPPQFKKNVEKMKNKKKAKKDYKESLQDRLTSKLSEATQTCNECGKAMLTASEKKELAELEEGKRHGNSKIYKKCWKGCRKVAGKKRGEPGSCKCD